MKIKSILTVLLVAFACSTHCCEQIPEAHISVPISVPKTPMPIPIDFSSSPEEHSCSLFDRFEDDSLSLFDKVKDMLESKLSNRNTKEWPSYCAKLDHDESERKTVNYQLESNYKADSVLIEMKETENPLIKVVRLKGKRRNSDKPNYSFGGSCTFDMDEAPYKGPLSRHCDFLLKSLKLID